MQTEDGFTVLDISSREAVAVQEVKLPGGPETGNFVYIRPVYGMPLLKSQRMMKLGSELILIFLTGAVLILSARRPLRAIKQDLSTVELSNLKGAMIPTDKAPLELLPIIEEFNEMVGRLRHSSSNQKQFAATISHEFRTPLTVISGFIQSVLNRGEEHLLDHHKQALGIADTEVLRLNRMLSDLLDLSRADNQQLSIRREAFELIPNLEQVLKLAKAAYGNPITDNLKELPYLEVVGDPDRLVQCIGNLIGNAVKYSEKGSPIDLHVSSDDSKVTVCVSDHGQGIPADQLDTIFERFTRAEGVVLPKGESSTGLGLSIVKMLMEAMGGTVSVRSTVDEGSLFSLQLPLSDQP
ncbi:sensor histidine kinase [Synechococcus sp. Cu2B8-bc1011]|uniref:sensor histidine kinase n=1 Tax=Synechococcus sp. Cu2B8-bc1011 TaxID=3093725 RepID=UPI0039B10E02